MPELPKTSVWLWNISYVVPRLVGLLAMVGVFALLWYLAWWNEHPWWLRLLALGAAGGLLAWSGYAAATAVWAVRLSDSGVEVRWLLWWRVYEWTRIEEVRAVDLRLASHTRYLGRHVAIEIRRPRPAPLVRVLVRPHRLNEVATVVDGRTAWSDQHDPDCPPAPRSFAGKALWLLHDAIVMMVETLLGA